MQNLKFPGVYPSIRDLSGVISTNTTTACAYVGEAEYGPVFVPTLLGTLQDYSDKFGRLSSVYGYAGYSLAVAAETIGEHRFVRVVPVGDPNAEKEGRVNDAHWAATNIMTAESVKLAPASEGYFYEEIMAAQTARDAGLDSGLFQPEDLDTAMIFTATDPNNRKFFITIADSTINENKAAGVAAPTTFVDKASTSTDITVTIPKNIVPEIAAGDHIVVSNMSVAEMNGVFKVTEVNAEDSSNVKITYNIKGTFSEVDDSAARIGFYPEPNETTFSVSVIEKLGRVYQTVEFYEYCTLYAARDNFGNSMYIEDVINNSSNYVQVFVNKNKVNADPDAIVQPAFVVKAELAGGKSGAWTDMGQKYKDLNNAWEVFRDRSQTAVSILMNSGYVTKENVSYQAKMLEIAESRRDCFCLFDSPMTEANPEKLKDWRRNIQGFNSYRGAVYGPWIKTYDSAQGRANFNMCPSAYIAKIMGASEPWVAPAGLNRGIIGATVVSPTGLTEYYNTLQGGILYADNQINCIIKNAGSGYAVWGQRTLQAKPSALDRINVARTVIYIETVLREAAKWHLFENNTAYERLQITLQFNSFLDEILAAEGIQKYQVICNEQNNTPTVIANNQLAIDVFLYPTYTTEVIKLQSVVMGADVNVQVSVG